MAKASFNLFLAKESCVEFDDLLTENSRQRLSDPNTYSFIFDGFADGARLHIFDRVRTVPAWIGRLRAEFGIETDIQTSSASGVLIFRTEGRLFATTFASGWMQLNDRKLEADFGLRVAINGLDDTKLKILERANLGDALRGVHLSPFQRDLNSFGVDEALDLIRKISGTANRDTAADTMSGAQSLKVTGDFTTADLPELASHSLGQFGSLAYQRTSFKVLDVVRPMTDKEVIDQLDQVVVERIKNVTGDFELGLPITYDNQVVEYRFKGFGSRRTHPDLMLSHYTEALGDDLQNLSVNVLKTHKIVARFDEDERSERPWTIRTALIGSIQYDDGLYAINEGNWYRLDERFSRSVLSAFDESVLDWVGVQAPRPFLTRAIGINNTSNRSRYEREADYNFEIANDLQLICMDADLISVPQISNSDFEICDLLDLRNKRLIHVKKNSRRSSVLSHFFKQGANSAQNIRFYPNVMNQLSEKIRLKAGDEAYRLFLDAHSDESRRWVVEYWIADSRRANGGFEIPFFSKVTFRDEQKKMRAMNYDVVIRFIELRYPVG